MILPCAITLKPVDYHFSTEITGNIEDLYEEIDKNLKKSENSIDILPIIWERKKYSVGKDFLLICWYKKVGKHTCNIINDA